VSIPGLNATRMVFAAFGMFVGTWVSRLPAIKLNLELSELELGIALLGSPIGLILAMRVVAGLIERTSSRTVATWSVGLLAISGVLPALAWNMQSLFVTLVIAGAAFGAVDIAMNTQAAAIERASGRPLMSGIHGWYSIGVLAGAGLGSAAATFDVTPLVHFIVVGVAVGITASIGSRSMLASDRDVADPDRASADPIAAPPGSWFGLFRNPRIALVGAIALAAFFVEGSIDDWSGIYLHEVQGASLGVAPLGAAACALGMTIARFRGDGLVTRVGRPRALQRGAIIATAGMAIAVLSPDPLLAIIGYAVAGVGVANIIPIAFTLAGNVPGIAPAQSIARVTTMGYAGLFLGPPVIGFLAHATSLGPALMVSAALLLGIAVAARAIPGDDSR
jgi:MFS family permease